jgi:hypothetical protein
LSSVYIHQSLEDVKGNKGDDKGEPTLIEMFFDRGCDEATAIIMALDMMFAGIDASSHLSAYALYRLARNPEVQERLYQEIKTELPSRDSKIEKKALERWRLTETFFCRLAGRGRKWGPRVGAGGWDPGADLV